MTAARRNWWIICLAASGVTADAAAQTRPERYDVPEQIADDFRHVTWLLDGSQATFGEQALHRFDRKSGRFFSQPLPTATRSPAFVPAAGYRLTAASPQQPTVVLQRFYAHPGGPPQGDDPQEWARWMNRDASEYYFWDVRQRAPSVTSPFPTERYLEAAVSPGGDLLAMAGYEVSVDVLKGDGLRQRPRRVDTHETPIVKLWDLKSGKLLNTLRGHSVNVSFMAFSADNRRIVTTGALGQYFYLHELFVWDVETGKIIRKIYSDDNQPTVQKNAAIGAAVAGVELPSASPVSFVGDDDHLLFSKGSDVIVWSIAGGQAVFQQPDAGWPVASATGPVIAYRLVQDGAIVIWSLQQGKEVGRVEEDVELLKRRFKWRTVDVHPIALLQDGKLLVTLTIADGRIRELTCWPAESWTVEAGPQN